MTSTAFIHGAVLPAPSRSDRITLRFLADGDAEGLRRLLAEHGGKVREQLRTEFVHLRDQDLLDDVMSVASVRAWRSRHRFDPDRGTLRGWLLVIARSSAARYVSHRSRSGVRFAANLDLLCKPDHGLDSKAEAIVNDVRRCVRNLPRQQRYVIAADLAGDGVMASNVLAAEMGVASHSVKMARTRGMQKLKAALRKLGYPLPLSRRSRDCGPQLSETPA